MCSFIVKLPLDVEFEMGLEADAAVWRNVIDPVDAQRLIDK
jgi:hypothetical protein